MKEFLYGRALTEFNALPEEYRDKSFRDCLEWLKDRLMGGSRYAAIDLERRLRELKVGSKKVEQVCQEVEYLVHKLHSEAVKQEEVKQRQLIFLYETNRDWYSGLLRMMDGGNSYVEMKEYLMREEYVERRLSVSRSNVIDKGMRNNNHGNHFNNRGGGYHVDRDKLSKIKCSCCQGIGHEELRCPTKSDTRGHFSDRQCIVCGGKGHTLKVCISDQSMKYVWRTMGGQSETLRGGVIQPPSRYPASGANASPLGSGGHNGIRGGGHGGSVNLPKPAVRMLALKCEEMKDEAENNVPFQQETSVKVCDVVETPKVSYSTHPKSDVVEEPKRVHENTHLAEEVVWEEDKKESEADDPFFVKRSQLVSGLIGGLQVEACLDTGADVNLIDKLTVDKMNGVSIVPGIKWNIQDAQRNSVKTLGTVLLDVKMEIGKECKVGFVVS